MNEPKTPAQIVRDKTERLNFLIRGERKCDGDIDKVIKWLMKDQSPEQRRSVFSVVKKVA